MEQFVVEASGLLEQGGEVATWKGPLVEAKPLEEEPLALGATLLVEPLAVGASLEEEPLAVGASLLVEPLTVAASLGEEPLAVEASLLVEPLTVAAPLGEEPLAVEATLLVEANVELQPDLKLEVVVRTRWLKAWVEQKASWSQWLASVMKLVRAVPTVPEDSQAGA